MPNLSDKAGEFFARPKTREFLDKKYPGQSEALGQEIAKFFSGESKEATLSDLTTHRAGVGDLTRDQARLFAKNGLEREYSLPELANLIAEK